MPVPSTIVTTTVCVENTVPACGRPVNSASSALKSPSPSTSPNRDASAPITALSRSTDRRTCRREAPSVRSVASSRVRCATVIEMVLKMTKAPTNSAMPANASRMYLMPLSPPVTDLLTDAASAADVRTISVRAGAGGSALRSARGVTPGLPTTEMLS